MAESKDDRRKRLRQESSCENPLPSLRKDTLPAGRPTPDCDVPVTPVAEPFLPPAPCPPPVTPATVIPDPLDILNDEVTATCPAAPPKNGPEGTPVVVAAGNYVVNFFFTSITGITANQLTFISSISAGERTELATPSTTVSRIIEITGLDATQAAQLKGDVTALKNEVNATAAEAAYGLLICFWENLEQVVYCPAGAILNDDILSLPLAQQSFVNNPSTVAAGTFTSTVSQSEANALALAAANDALLCLYGNEEVTRTCSDLGFTEPITDVDLIADTLDGQVRKGSATIPANTVFSADDVASANIAAEAIADSLLSCFYINPQVTVSCSSEGRVAGSPGTSGPPVGNALTGTPGQLITVPAGFLTSTTSTNDAQDLAISYALGLLECWICNNPVTVTCPPQEYVDKEGNVLLRDPSPLSSPITVTIPACTIRSTESQADADERALAAAKAQLNCIYCNPVIPPTCVPAGFETPPVSLNAYNRSTWSRDASAGQVADVFCCQGEGAAQNCYEIADGVASVPIDTRVNDEDCRYGNDPKSKVCGGDVYFNEILVEMRGGGSAYVPANVFFVGASAGGKAQANLIAQEFVDSAVQCFWHNFAQVGQCPFNTTGIVFTQPARTVQSFSSQADANDLALVMANAKSICSPSGFYTNEAVTCVCLCPEGQQPLNCPTIPAGTVTSSVSQSDADTIAGELACDLVVCGSSGEDGMPGNDGAQQDCAGTCYGYYS